MQLHHPFHKTVSPGEVVSAHKAAGKRTRSLKVLFLACSFPPAQGSACVRTWNIAKHLARLGWAVTVVTPDPAVWRNIDDPRKVSQELDRHGIKRILTGHRWRCLSPYALNCWNGSIGWALGGTCRKLARRFGIDSAIGWINEAESACRSLTTDDVDVILATGPPFSAFVLAKRLSEKLGCPYVLDYRDPWVVHPDSTSSAKQGTEKLERQLIERCAAVTVVSRSLLKDRINARSKLHVVTNGYDPEEMASVQPYEFGHFAIVYAGNFYPPKRVITPLMQALRCLKEKDPGRTAEWRFHYYGVHGDHVHKEAEKFVITDKVMIHGRVPRAEALSAVRGSNVAVVITSVLEEKAEQDGGIVTGKIFELLGLHIPILLIGPSGADVDEIVETAGLTRKVTASDINGMVSFLEEVMAGSPVKIKCADVYAWPNVIRELHAVLREAVEERESLSHQHKTPEHQPHYD